MNCTKRIYFFRLPWVYGALHLFVPWQGWLWTPTLKEFQIDLSFNVHSAAPTKGWQISLIKTYWLSFLSRIAVMIINLHVEYVTEQTGNQIIHSNKIVAFADHILCLGNNTCLILWWTDLESLPDKRLFSGIFMYCINSVYTLYGFIQPMYNYIFSHHLLCLETLSSNHLNCDGYATPCSVCSFSFILRLLMRSGSERGNIFSSFDSRSKEIMGF